MNRLLLCLVLAAASVAPLPVRAQALATTPIDSIVAIVEEDVILRSELDRAVASILAQYSGSSQQLPPREVLERQVLERLVLLKLQLQRAHAAGVRVSDAELDQTVRNIAQQNNITLEQMRAQLAREGLDYEEFRQNLREELTAQRLRQGVVQSRVNVSETEIDILLASNSLRRGQVNAAHILVALPDGADQQQIETAKEKIEGVRNLIQRGEMDFRSAAIRYSDSPNALEGGGLGWRSYDEVPALFANLLQGMRPGEVSPAVRGPSGFHLVQLIESREDAQETITEYKARGILIRSSDLVTMEQAREKAQQVRSRILAGEDFAKVAAEVSEDGMTRNQGGDMGWFQPYAWGTSVGAQVLALADGEISQPFASEVGYHVILREGSRVQDVTEETRRNRAREMIGRRKSEEEFERFVRQLRDEAFVELRLSS